MSQKLIPQWSPTLNANEIRMGADFAKGADFTVTFFKHSNGRVEIISTTKDKSFLDK